MVHVDISKSLQSASGPMQLEVQLTISANELITLYGPSGAGKTSVLRMLCGLMQPDSGKIEVDGRVWFDSRRGINVPAQKRNVGMLFQDYALFPHMTVRANLEYALSKNQSSSYIDELISIVDLKSLEKRMPSTLSGGQKQRVALARALVRKPKLLLLDEPLSSLDNDMRQKLQGFLLKAHKEFGLTTILVSHDVGEIIRLSDRIISIDDGAIQYAGTPPNLFYGEQVSGKVQLHGQVLSISKEDVIYVVSVLCGKEIVKVVVADPKRQGLSEGDHVLIAAKAFNPIIKKLKE